MSLLDIMDRAGDGNVGQTLLRLATLAEAAHLGREARDVGQGSDHTLIDEIRRDVRVEGLDPMSVAAARQNGAASAGKEADR